MSIEADVGEGAVGTGRTDSKNRIGNGKGVERVAEVVVSRRNVKISHIPNQIQNVIRTYEYKTDSIKGNTSAEQGNRASASGVEYVTKLTMLTIQADKVVYAYLLAGTVTTAVTTEQGMKRELIPESRDDNRWSSARKVYKDIRTRSKKCNRNKGEGGKYVSDRGRSSMKETRQRSILANEEDEAIKQEQAQISESE